MMRGSGCFGVAALVFSLVAGLTLGLPPVAVAAAVSGEVSVPVSPVAATPVGVPAMPLARPAVVPVWPVAGSVTVDLGAPGVVSPLAGDVPGVAGLVWPGGLPVTVTVPAAESGGGSVDPEFVEQQLLRGRRVPGVSPGSVSPESVSVVSLSTWERSRVVAAGVRGVVLTVANAGAPIDGSAPVRVDVSYAAFAQAYGGGFGDRLRLVRLPGCAVDTPQVAQCLTQSPLPQMANDKGSQTVSAVVDLGLGGGSGSAAGSTSVQEASSGSAVLAVTSGSSSLQGDWAATSLSQTASWSSGGSGGDFTYSVPVTVPPAPGGLTPQIAFSYSSGSVDGLTESTNTQASWIGEGWDYEPGYVERSYRPCTADGSGPSNDLCWVSEGPLSLVLNGKATRLIKNNDQSDPLYQWKAEDDSDGWKVDRFTDGANGEREWFKVTTADGTQYLFGSKPKAAYGGVLTVPVYSNNPGEPCYHPSGFHYSHCTMPYRWNLDRVIDVHGNVIDYQWSQFVGNYGADGNSDVFGYDIHGTLLAVEYGANLTVAGARHTGRVEFTTGYRCFDTVAGCDGEGNRYKWLDTPWDQYCQTWASSCPGQSAPTFWIIYRLTGVHTKIWDIVTGTWMAVASWQTTQSFPDTTDVIAPFGQPDSSPSLWLWRLWRPGFPNPVELTGWQEHNRVDWGAAVAPMAHWRVGWIRTGTGETVQAGYSGHDCTSSSLPGNASESSRRCFPQNNQGQVSWWHKYVTNDVIVWDEVGGSPPERWSYTYSAAGSSTAVLWKHDWSWHTAPQFRTWSRWAGYPTVITTHAAVDGSGPVQVSEDLYFRGMYGDKTSSGMWDRPAVIDDDWDHQITDDPALAGRVRRSFVWDGPVNADRTNWTGAVRHHHDVVNTAAQSIAAPNTTIYASRVREVTTLGQEKLAGAAYRHTETHTLFEPGYGLPTKVEDLGDATITTDDRCVLTDYAPANTGVWLVGLPTQTVTTDCATTPTAANILAAGRTTYDNLAYAAMPTLGMVTLAQAAKQATAYPPAAADLVQTGRSGYDGYGRVVDSFDALDRQNSTGYSPATGGPVTTVTATGPSISGQRWNTTTTLDPKLGVPVKVADINGRITQARYDSAGRLLKVWKNHRAPQDSDTNTVTPDVEYGYSVNGSNWVSTKTLGPDGQQILSYQIFDGRLRPRQTQTVSATGTGRAITLTSYHPIGQAAAESVWYNNDSGPATTLVTAADKDINVQQRFVYDNLGRTTNAQQWTGDGTTTAMLWQTLTGYDGGKTVTVTPPAGGTATTTIRDVRGRTVELRQHQGGTPAGAYSATTHTHNRLDQLIGVKDIGNNTWSYTYDLLGRKTRTVDPDAGTSTSTFDNAGQITSTTDGTGNQLFYSYDGLGRKTALRQDNPTTGLLRATWTYDTTVLAGTTAPVKGQLAATTRYQAGQAYTHTVDTYDNAYRPAQTTTTVPGFGPAGATLTYTTTSSYKPNGAMATHTLPAAGGLPGETLTHTYHSATGLPRRLTTTASQGSYLDDTTYYYDGLVYHRFLGAPGARVRIQANYDAPTRRLSGIHVNTETPGTPGTYGTSRLANDLYTYDPAGNLTALRTTTNNIIDQRECFRYDHLRRLTEAWTQTASTCTTGQRGGVDPYWRQWSFDTLGNRLTQTDKNPTTGDTTWTHTIGLAAGIKPHQLKTITSTGPHADTATRNFSYDPAGNTTSRTTPTGAAQSLTWDPEGHLATLTESGQTTSYTYDTSGNRLITASPTRKTLYLPDGTEMEKIGTADPLATRHYSGIAVRDTAGLRWVVADHHGTPMAQIDPATLAIARRRSLPYGEPHGPQAADWKGSKGYVGGTRDDTGLTHLGAREYDPSLGRFISVDPVMDLSDPQQWNAYTYANNNPVTYSDPTGLKPQFDDLEDQHAWQAAGGNQFPRKKRLKGYFKHNTGPRTDNPVLAGINSFVNGMYDITLGGLVQYGQFVADQAQRGYTRWSNVLSGQWTLSQAWDDYVTNTLPHQPKPWDNAMSLVDLATMAVNAQTALAQGDLKTAAENYGYLGGIAAGIALTERAFKFGRSGCNSFAPTTPVLMANGTTKHIRDVNIGDQILATDPQSGVTGPRQVTDLIVGHGDKQLVELTIHTTNGDTTIIATANHPFWNQHTHQWTDATRLKPGTPLLTPNGATATVKSARTYTANTTVNNLTIADIHTYYVLAGNTPVLVHNTGPCGPNLDAMSAAGQVPAKGGLTAAGRAYQKHMGRGELPTVAGKDLNSAGQNLLDDILTDPYSDFQTINGGAFKGGTRVISNRVMNGQFVGAVYDANGTFQYFGLFS